MGGQRLLNSLSRISVEELLLRYRNIAVLVAIVFVQLVLLGYQVKRNDNVRLLRVWTMGTVAPAGKALNQITDWVSSEWSHYLWLVGARRDNDSLRRDIARLKLENEGLRRGLERLERQETLVAYQTELPSQTVLSEIIGVGANSNSKEVFLDKGREAGILPGMPVITPDGIAGKVQAAYSGSSLVLLINDRESGVGVLLGNSRARGVLKGTGASQCRVEYVGHEVDVQEGETVYTSGDDRVYPKGLKVGAVSKLEDGGDFRKIHVKPFAALNRLDEVLVITAGVHQELPAAPGPQTTEYLMPLPPIHGGDLITQRSSEPAPPGELPAGAAVPSEELSPAGAHLPLTEADRIKQRYRAIAAAQGHRFGEGKPGSRPPDFNLGLTSLSRGQPDAPPPAAPTPAQQAPAAERPAPGARAETSGSAEDRAPRSRQADLPEAAPSTAGSAPENPAGDEPPSRERELPLETPNSGAPSQSP